MDWREEMEARAKAQKTIRDTIRILPPAYRPELKKEEKPASPMLTRTTATSGLSRVSIKRGLDPDSGY